MPAEKGRGAPATGPAAAAAAAAAAAGDLPGLDAAGDVLGLDDQSGAFWDALVDAGGLGAKWERLGRRVRALEASPSLDPGFLASLMRRTLEEPLGGLRGQLEGRLDELAQSLASHALRLDRTEGLAPAVRECGLRLDSWHDRAEEQDRALATLAARVDALQEQAEGGAVAARASFAREADLAARHSALQERVEALAELVGADRAAGQAERAQRQRQLDELLARSEEGRRQLEDVVRQLPVMRAEVTDECRRHAERLVAPIAPQVRNVQAILERRLEDAGSQHEAAKRRLDEVEDRMKEQAQAQAEKGHISESMVTDLDERIQRKLRRQSEDFSDLGTSVAEKFGELVERVTQLQSVFQVHEHALRHHAEEMLNRCTRYDIMMCHEQIGKCVTSGTLQQLKVHLDKVHARQAEWSRQCCAALHREGLAITLRPVDPQEHPAPPEDEHPACGRSAEDRSADAAGSSAESSAEALASATVEDAPSRLGSASSEGSAAPSQDEWARGPERCGLAVPAANATATVLYHQVRQQLESVAQALVGLGHVAIRSLNTSLSRDVRQGCENQLMHHLSCLMHWITHQSVPSGWEPSKLEALAHCATQNDDDRVVELHKLAGYKLPERSRAGDHCRSRPGTSDAAPSGGGTWGALPHERSLASTLPMENSLCSLVDSSTDTATGAKHYPQKARSTPRRMGGMSASLAPRREPGLAPLGLRPGPPQGPALPSLATAPYVLAPACRSVATAR